MFGLIGKNTAKMNYSSPGRTGAGNGRGIAVLYMGQSSFGTSSPFTPYRAGRLDISDGIYPDQIKYSDIIKPSDQEEIQVIKLIRASGIGLPANRVTRNNIGRAGYRNSTIYSYDTLDELIPSKEVSLFYHRPDVFKYISIDDAGSGGGGGSTMNTIINDVLDIREFLNVTIFFIFKCTATEIKLPSRVVRTVIGQASLLKEIELPETLKFGNFDIVSALEDINVPVNMENFRLTLNSLIDFSNKFVGTVKLEVLLLGIFNFADQLYTRPPLNPATNWVILDLRNCPLKEVILDAGSKPVLFPDLSFIEKMSLNNFSDFSIAKYEELLSPNLQNFNAWNLSDVSSQNIDFTTTKIPNATKLSVFRGSYSYLHDFNDHQQLFSIFLAVVFCRGIHLNNVPNLQFVEYNNIGDFLSLSISRLSALKSMKITNCHLSYFDFIQKENINTFTNLQTLNLSEDTSVSGLGDDLNISGLVLLDNLTLSNSKLSGTLVLPLKQRYTSLRIETNNLLDEIINFDQITECTIILNYESTNLNLDLSNLVTIGSIIGNLTPTTIVDLSSVISNYTVLSFQECISLAVVTLPDTLGQSVQFSKCTSLVDITNFADLKISDLSRSTYKIQFDNCSLLNIELPFSNTFLIPAGGVLFSGCALDQTNVDASIDNLYNVRASLTENRQLNISGGTNAAPTGVFQEPLGFVLGSEEGAPSTPQEKIYVLVNNYNIIIITN